MVDRHQPDGRGNDNNDNGNNDLGLVRRVKGQHSGPGPKMASKSYNAKDSWIPKKQCKTPLLGNRKGR